MARHKIDVQIYQAQALTKPLSSYTAIMVEINIEQLVGGAVCAVPSRCWSLVERQHWESNNTEYAVVTKYESTGHHSVAMTKRSG